MNPENHDDKAAAVLAVRHLCLQLNGETLLKDLNFEVYAGEKVCLLGASGSGKSLTARAIIGTPAFGARISGSVKVAGEEVAHLHPLRRAARSQVSAIFQDSASALNPLMSIGQQLRLPQRRRDNEALHQLLSNVGLGHIADLLQRYPAQLSGGQRQRVCIALALMSNNALLVADEPTTALDVIAQRRVLQVLDSVCTAPEAPALLFITHDIAVAAQFCDRALVMEKGRIVESATLSQLLHRPQHAYSRSLIAAARQNSLPSLLTRPAMAV